jgi:hypothetical protein
MTMARHRGQNEETAGATATAMSRPGRRLLHPVWVAALLLLVVNDHLLKGVGVLPGWVTGKLSDFAGLIVAPVLLAHVMRARGPAARAACYAAVAIVFAAVKLLPGAAHLVESAVGVLGIRWHIWCDATDLAALVVLPVAWRIAGPPLAVSVGTVARGFERAGVIAAAAACLATSSGVERPRSHLNVSLTNATAAPVDVMIYRAAQPLACDALAAGDHTSLTPASFEIESCMHLDRGEREHLGQTSVVASDVNVSDHPQDVEHACEVVGLRAEGLPDTVLFWRWGYPYDPADGGELVDEHVQIDGSGEAFRLTGSAFVQAWTADAAFPAVCPMDPTALRD